MATDAPPANKSSQGRKKIEMKLIKKKTARMVTFSKRRASLFRKASELATLCNAHLAIMIFSPGGKIYSFGHPSVGAVLERYESSTRNNGAAQRYRAEFMRMAAVKAEKTLRLKMELQQTLDDIQATKEKIKLLDMVWEKEHATRCWWNAPVEEMDMACCKALEEKLMDLRMEVEAKLKIINQAVEGSKKDVTDQVTPGKNVVAPSVGDLAPNRSADIMPNNLLAGWINSVAHSAQNYLSGLSNAAGSSNVTSYIGTEFYSFGGSTRTSTATMPGASSSTSGTTTIGHGLGSKNYGVGPNPTNFNNFPF